jgi:hypothetical protein
LAFHLHGTGIAYPSRGTPALGDLCLNQVKKEQPGGSKNLDGWMDVRGCSPAIGDAARFGRLSHGLVYRLALIGIRAQGDMIVPLGARGVIGRRSLDLAEIGLLQGQIDLAAADTPPASGCTLPRSLNEV